MENNQNKNSNCTIQEHLVALYGPTGLSITQTTLDEINAQCKTCLKPTIAAYNAQKTVILHPDHTPLAITHDSVIASPMQQPQLIA